MRFGDLNWMDVESYLKQDDRVMIVLGACEQHGYLSLLSDVRIPEALADAASQQTGVLVAPPINFGCSEYFLDFPGTISLSVTTISALLKDLVRSLYRQGFRQMLILNGHGGNLGAKAVLFELCNELPELKFNWYDWWIANRVVAVSQKHGLKGAHANWLENFAFTRVGDIPEEPKQPFATKALGGAAYTREQIGDGSYGGPYAASPEILGEIFSTALEDIIDYLNFDSAG